MPTDLLRDSTLGQFIRALGGKKHYQNEGSPEKPQARPRHSSSGSTLVDQDATEAQESKNKSKGEKDQHGDVEQAGQDGAGEKEQQKTPAEEAREKGYILVDWYGEDDPDNPLNYSFAKKCGITAVIAYLTFAVYVAAAITTPGESFISQDFGVSSVAVSLDLALYVAGYGSGPLIWSPLSEIPKFGRNLFYIYPYMAVFGLSFLPAFTPNFGGLLVGRFLTAFLASPALATGGASLADIFKPQYLPYAFSTWGLVTVCGPTVGPTISTFAVYHFQDWRWSFYIQLMITGLALVIIILFLPETSGPTILLRRAERLRKLTGNDKLRSAGELELQDLDKRAILMDALIKPFETAVKDPSILFSHFYLMLLYCIYYLFFTSFPQALGQVYGWDENSISLAFLTELIFISLGAAVYITYYYFVTAHVPFENAERKLDTALWGSLCIPTGMFIHAFTSKPSISPYVGLFGIGLFAFGVFQIFLSILFYISTAYPKYAASILAGNDFFRSIGAAGLVVAGTPFYGNVGIAGADATLAGISCLGIPAMFYLWRYGDRLRARSKFASA